MKKLIISLLISGAAFAQNYPDRNIKILQGFAPGGNADAIARAVGSEISKSVGQSVVVEAQAGAGGDAAADERASAEQRQQVLHIGVVAAAFGRGAAGGRRAVQQALQRHALPGQGGTHQQHKQQG